MASIIIREGRPTDRSFLNDTIHKTLLESSAYFHHVSPQSVRLLLDPILATFKILVAAPETDPGTIIGYIVFESPTVVAFIYVRSQFRSELKDGVRQGGGVARSLLQAAGVKKSEIECPLMVTGLNHENFPLLASKKGYKLRFRPYMPLEIAAMLYQETRSLREVWE